MASRPRVAIVYNEPAPSRYAGMNEEKAVLGVLDEVKAVQTALEESGYLVFKFPLLPPLGQAKARLKTLNADTIFNLFEGFDGAPETEYLIADVLFKTSLPCTGNPPSALALALDKAKTKAVLKQAGIRTPGYQVLMPDSLTEFRLGFPCIIKPVAEDASHGVTTESIVNDKAQLERQVEKVSRLYGGRALVEEFLNGREFNVTVLGNNNPRLLPISEIIYSLPEGLPHMLIFESKWESTSPYYTGTEPQCPANITPEERDDITNSALTSYKLVACRGYARVDMRMDSEGKINVLEVNPNPDISPVAGCARQALASGMTYNQFIEEILRLAAER